MVKELKFRETLYGMTGQLAHELDSLVALLESLTVLSPTSEFKDWHTVKLALRAELAQLAQRARTEGPEEAVVLFSEMLRVRDDLLAQVLRGLLHKKILL